MCPVTWNGNCRLQFACGLSGGRGESFKRHLYDEQGARQIGI